MLSRRRTRPVASTFAAIVAPHSNMAVGVDIASMMIL
jgi:hypothetical protein